MKELSTCTTVGITNIKSATYRAQLDFGLLFAFHGLHSPLAIDPHALSYSSLTKKTRTESSFVVCKKKVFFCSACGGCFAYELCFMLHC